MISFFSGLKKRYEEYKVRREVVQQEKREELLEQIMLEQQALEAELDTLRKLNELDEDRRRLRSMD